MNITYKSIWTTTFLKTIENIILCNLIEPRHTYCARASENTSKWLSWTWNYLLNSRGPETSTKQDHYITVLNLYRNLMAAIWFHNPKDLLTFKSLVAIFTVFFV